MKRRAALTILEALRDPRLFGALPAFRDLGSWSRWLVFLKAVYGLPLEGDELQVFQAHTGRAVYAPPPGGWREVVCVVGRQSGKSRVAATLAAFEALTAERQGDRTELYALLVAQDQRAAVRTLFAYARAAFEVPVLRTSVVAETADTLRLSSGVVLAAYPCRPAAVRGLRARVAVADELAHFRSSDNLPVDREMLRALRPTLATTGGKLVVLSSPYGQAGALWELWRQHHGRPESPVLVWQGSAPEMNPTLPADYLARLEEEDPESYRAEVLGEFLAGVSALFDPGALEAVTARGLRERPAAPGGRYVAFCDPSGGRHDRFALAVAHAEAATGRAVLDLVRWWAAPFDPARVVAEVAEVLRAYGCRVVHGDKYAGEFTASLFREHGLVYRPAERTASETLLELLPLVNAGRVVLLDVPILLRELRGLERHRGVGGRERVDHRRDGFDDVAVAAAGALVAAWEGRRGERRLLMVGGGSPLPATF